MPRKSEQQGEGFFYSLKVLLGVAVIGCMLWLVALVVLAVVIFVGMTVFTNWDLAERILWSFVGAWGALKLISGIASVGDVLPASWFQGKPELWPEREQKTKPCPQCGKNLRTAIARQCMHCGADWHDKPMPGE